ncbi:MAG TPA: hypothetical protein PLA19_02655 [Candidatus Pacearchaeota archaeon]|nr:hypothetical protein [Candidatus Pacearchaeota archaeon]
MLKIDLPKIMAPVAMFLLLCLPAVIVCADETADAPADNQGSGGSGEAVLVSPLQGDLTVEDIAGKISGVIFGLALMVCPILIIWGGFEIATAGGDQNKITKGKQIITFSMVGLAIIALSAAFVEAIKQILGAD